MEVGGVTINRGDAVILSLNAANRDPRACNDPETCAPEREERGHVGFGHGKHFCIGAGLARIELRVVFETLARRLPRLRLAAALDDIEVKTGHITGGVTSLPSPGEHPGPRAALHPAPPPPAARRSPGRAAHPRVREPKECDASGSARSAEAAAREPPERVERHGRCRSVFPVNRRPW